jgi:segregation and condensation protein A
MGFEEFLPKEEEPETIIEDIEKISPNQVYDVITSKKPDWQTILYDLINTSQLDPWDLDLIILTKKYFEKIEELEETDFYISSKVLLAAALLLRIKTEFLLNRHIKNIDEALFGRKEEKKEIERIEIDESELPILMPRTPLSRLRRVTLPELMSALNKAINTESRRIKREVQIKRAHKLSHVDIPKFKKIDLKDRIKGFYARVLNSLNKKELQKIGYFDLIGKEKDEKLACFLPLLHLSNTKKLWLEQENHLDEILIYLYKYFENNKDKFMEELEEDIEEMKAELESAENIDRQKTGLEKAREKREERKKLEEQAKKELAEELGIEIESIDTEEKIEKITGFNNESL